MNYCRASFNAISLNEILKYYRLSVFLCILECARQHLLRFKYGQTDAHTGDLSRRPAVPGKCFEQFRRSFISHLRCCNGLASRLYMVSIIVRASEPPAANKMGGAQCLSSTLHNVCVGSNCQSIHNSVE